MSAASSQAAGTITGMMASKSAFMSTKGKGGKGSVTLSCSHMSVCPPGRTRAAAASSSSAMSMRSGVQKSEQDCLQ